MQEEGPEVLEEEIPVFKRCFVNSEEYIANYKLFGPANPQVNAFKDDNDYNMCEYSQDGICYMLTCNCMRDDPDVPNKDWYNGKCNYIDPDGYSCKITFNDKTEAWRTPLDGGGFNGCFCKDHFRRCIPRPKDKDEFSLFHTLCDIMIMVREKYPIQQFQDFDANSSIQIYEDYEDF